MASLAYETTEKKLRREFEQFGPIKNVKMVLDNDGKPRGYAFIEFEREEDMTNAYKRGNGRKIDGRRVIVDVERGRFEIFYYYFYLGRTVRDWRPRRFGGGLGGRKPKKSKKEIATDEIRALAARGQQPAERRPDRDRGGGGDRGRSDRDRGGGHGHGFSGDRGFDRSDRDRPRGDKSGLGYKEHDNSGNHGGGHYGPPSGGSNHNSSYQPERKRPRSRERDDRGSGRHNDDRGRGDPEGGRYERRRRSRSPDRGRY